MLANRLVQIMLCAILTLGMERRVRPRRGEPVPKPVLRSACTGRLAHGGTGTLVQYNPTGHPRDADYDRSRTLVGCLTAAHTSAHDALILPNGRRLELVGRAEGGFSFVGHGAGDRRGRTYEEKQHWRSIGSDWRFISVAVGDEIRELITSQNVEELVGVAPYRLEYQNAPIAIEGRPLHNIYYLNEPRAQRARQRQQHDSVVTRPIAGDRIGMFRASGLLGPGASGSPYYDEKWNLVGIHRGSGFVGSVFTGINTVLDGHHGQGGLREDVLNSGYTQLERE